MPPPSHNRRKRRSLPDEDLAAAVQDIIDSPITKVNLGFLYPVDRPSESPAEPPAPLAEPSDESTDQTAPTGPVPTPMGLSINRMGPDSNATEPGGSAAQKTTTSKDQPPIPMPMGLESIPMALSSMPSGFDLKSIKPPSSFDFPATTAASAAPRQSDIYWQADKIGTLFPDQRVRRIVQAQDALSLVEEKVYDLLWGQRRLNREEYRLCHYSLQRIATEARINIKTVRELVPRLIDKGFIEIEAPADVKRNVATLYRVWSYGSVLNRQNAAGWHHVVKTGKGVFYVRPLRIRTTPMGVDLEPLGIRPMGADPKPTPPTPTGPLGAGSAKPLGASGPPSVDSRDNAEEVTTTAADVAAETVQALQNIIRTEIGYEADSLILCDMIADCRREAVLSNGETPDDGEILYFAQTKARVLRRSTNIRNHLAVLRKALPVCFSGVAYQGFKKAWRPNTGQGSTEPLSDQKEDRFALWTEISNRHRTEHGFDLKAIAEDPDLDKVGKEQAVALMRRGGRYSSTGL